MQQAFSMSQFRDTLNSDVYEDPIRLEGKNIDYIFSSFIINHPRMSKKSKLEIANMRSILHGLNPDIMPRRFNEDFNAMLFGYLVAEEGLSLRPSSAKQYIRRIIKVLRWAGTHGASLTLSYEYVPTDNYESHKICPTMEELAQIYYFNIESLPYRKDCRMTLERVRDTYVMNSIGYGLRYSDLSRVNSTSFNGNELKMVQQKTGRVVTNSGNMILYKQIMNQLMDKYPGHVIPYQGNIGNYNRYLKKLFQHLGGTFDNVEVIEYKAGGSMHRIEKKRWQCFSSHSSRRGYVTNNVCEKKRNLMDVQHAVGHKSSKTTEGYIVYGNE